MTDPISDMLTRIRNASKVRKQIVDVPMSKMKFALAKVLQNEGYLDAVEKVDGLKGVNIRLRLKYDQGEEYMCNQQNYQQSVPDSVWLLFQLQMV